MANATSKPSSNNKTASVPSRILNVLASIQLATFLILALFVLTWFATLEQTVNGLKPMMDKYFNWKQLFFFPEIGRPWQEDGVLIPIKIYFPMLSGFWLCALFTLNLTLGGLIRFRKTPQKLGILLSHFSIVFLMVSAGVTQLTEKRGALQIYEGKVSDAAQDYHHEVIEVSELSEGKVTQVHLIDWELLKDLRNKDRERLFKMKALPFDLKVSNLIENAQLTPEQFVPPQKKEPVLDGFYLKKLPRQKETEAHLGGAEVTVVQKDGSEVTKLLVGSRSLHPATVTFEGKDYLLRMRKKLWPLPFGIQLDEFRVERDPGTRRAAAFESDITRLDDGESEEVLIEMNEPMRREGWTFFQANWGPQNQENPEEYYSVFEVVRNPADQWPLYSLLVSMVGLIGHFVYRLVLFLKKPRKTVHS